MAITLTDKAVAEIRKQRDKRGTPEAGLRVGIRGGGCTGFSYLFEWSDSAPREKDTVVERDGVKLYVDPKSLVYLDGTTLDFVTSMMGYGFKFENPNVKSTCGCGESVQF
jgi:iron-sulfur cluster assembly protein